MIYFRLCFSFRCCGYDLTLIKKSHTLNFYWFLLFLVTVVAQFTAKTTNLEKVSYFLSLISCSMKKLKSHLLCKCKSFTKMLFFDLTWNKNFSSRKWWWGGGVGGGEGWCHPCPPFSTALHWNTKKENPCNKWDKNQYRWNLWFTWICAKFGYRNGSDEMIYKRTVLLT